MELFTAICKQFLYICLVSTDEIPRNNQEPYGNFRSTYLPFLLRGVGGQPLKVPLKSCLILQPQKMQTNYCSYSRERWSGDHVFLHSCSGNIPQELWLWLWLSEHYPWGNLARCSLSITTPKWCHNCLTTNISIRVMVHPNPTSSNSFVCSQGDEIIGVKMCSLLYLDVLYEHILIFNSQSLKQHQQEGNSESVLWLSYTPFLFFCFRVLVGSEKDLIFFIHQESKFRTISPRIPKQGAQINCSAAAKLLLDFPVGRLRLSTSTYSTHACIPALLNSLEMPNFSFT